MSPSAKQPEICLDTISQLSAPLRETSSLTPLVHLFTLAYQVKIPPRSKQERLRTLLNTLSPPEISSSKHTDPQVRLGSYIRFLSPVLNGFAGMAEFEAAVGAFSQPGEFREFWELEGKNLITEFVSDGSSERMIVGSDVPFLEEVVRDATCRIGLTEKQRMLVLLPAESEVGDGIWEIPGEGDLVVKRGDEDEPREIGRGYIDLAIS